MTSKILFAVTAAVTMSATHADIIGFDNGESSSYSSLTLSDDATTWGPGDWFGWGAYGAFPHPSGVPFTLADDTVADISGSGPFPPDTLGIIDSTTAPDDQFFGVVDVVNGSNADGEATATWTFDIAGFSDLSVSADFAAMGDFEAGNDQFSFSYSIDGAPDQVFFDFMVDEALSQNYTMESGTAVNLNDPLSLNGTLLNDILTTFSAALAGDGSLLTIEFFASTDGGSEGFVFDNLTVSGERVSEPGILMLFGAGLLAAGLGRRRGSLQAR